MSILRNMALADVAQWTECCPANKSVASLIPSQGVCLVYRAYACWQCVIGNHTLMSLSFSFSIPSLLYKIK